MGTRSVRRIGRAVVLGLVLLAGCGEPPEPTLPVRGVYMRPMYDGQAAVIDHEAIPDRMPAMEMPFQVAEPALLDGLEPGTKVRIQVDSVSLTTIRAIEPLPPATPLELYEGG